MLMVIYIKKYFKILLPLIICIALSSFFVYCGKSNYDALIKPLFSPPSIVFPIVWTIIYSIFYFTMIRADGNNKVYILYLISLSLHVLWNFSFFFLSFYIVGLIILLIIYFVGFVFVYNISQTKKSLLYIYSIYLIWLTIALYLNLGIVLLN